MNVGLFYMLTTQHPATCLNSYPSSLLTWPSSSSMCGSNVQLTHLFVGGLLMLVITCFSLKIANVSMQHKPHEFHASKLIQPRHFGTVVAVLSLTANTIPLATWWDSRKVSSVVLGKHTLHMTHTPFKQQLSFLANNISSWHVVHRNSLSCATSSSIIGRQISNHF